MNPIIIYFVNGTQAAYDLNEADHAYVCAQLMGTLSAYRGRFPLGRNRYEAMDGKSVSSYLEIPNGEVSDFYHPANILRVSLKINEKLTPRR